MVTACLACERPWVSFPAQQKQQRETHISQPSWAPWGTLDGDWLRVARASLPGSQLRPPEPWEAPTCSPSTLGGRGKFEPSLGN